MVLKQNRKINKKKTVLVKQKGEITVPTGQAFFSPTGPPAAAHLGPAWAKPKSPTASLSFFCSPPLFAENPLCLFFAA
jgi:hypothetical protein